MVFVLLTDERTIEVHANAKLLSARAKELTLRMAFVFSLMRLGNRLSPYLTNQISDG